MGSRDRAADPHPHPGIPQGFNILVPPVKHGWNWFGQPGRCEWL